MKAVHKDKGVVEITKAEWDKLFREIHKVPCPIDYRKYKERFADLKIDVCSKCGGIGVTDYNFKTNNWIMACRECRSEICLMK